MEVPYEKRFFFKDGSSAGSLEELYKKLEAMSYDEFYEHVNQEKNDFANWVEHVLNNKELADKMRLVTSMVETAEIIVDELHPEETHEDIQGKIEDELFSKLDSIHKDIQNEEEIPGLPDAEEEMQEQEEPNESFPIRKPVVPKPYDEAEMEYSRHPAMSDRESDELVRFHKEISGFMVKEFIYGLLFGLVLGFIIARVIGIVG